MKLLRELNQLSFTKEQITESVKTNNGILKLKGIIQRADAKNQNGRIYPRDILVKAIEPYMKLVKERRSHGELDHCYQGNSSILTISGWKQLKDISDNETILSLNTETSKIEAQEIRRKVVVEGYTGNLYRFSNGKNFSMTVSPNHKVLLWDRNGKPYKLKAFEVAEKLRNKDSKLAHSCVKHNFSYEPMNPKTHFTIPGTNTKIPMNLWAAFFGIWIAEGDVAGSRGGRVTNRVGLCQKKFEQTNMIQTEIMDLMIEHMHWNANVRKSDQTTYWNFRNDMLHSYMSQFGNSHTKFLPEEVFTEWSVEARETLLKWMLFGDGKNRTSNRTGRHVKEYATTSRRLAEDVHRLYVTLGYKPFIKVQEPKDVVIDGRDVFSENCSPVYVVAGNVSNTYVDYRFFSVEEIPVVDETLYCVTVENGTFMAMDADTKTTHWTGNCDEMVVNLKDRKSVV